MSVSWADACFACGVKFCSKGTSAYVQVKEKFMQLIKEESEKKEEEELKSKKQDTKDVVGQLSTPKKRKEPCCKFDRPKFQKNAMYSKTQLQVRKKCGMKTFCQSTL